MKKTQLTFGLAVGLALLGWLGYTSWPTNEKVIVSRLNSLAEELSLPSGEGVMMRTARAYDVSQYFSSDVSIDLSGVSRERFWRAGSGPINGRENLKWALLGAFETSWRLEISFAYLSVEMGADEESATVFASALIREQPKLGRQRESTGAQELKFEVKRNGRVWEITRVVTYRTLQ